MASDSDDGQRAPDDPEPPQQSAHAADSRPSDDVGRVDRLDVIVRAAGVAPEEARLVREALDGAIELLDAGVERLAVELVDDERMSLLHERWSGIAGTTDVLTFPMSASGESIDADLAVCVDEAGRRAAELGHDRALELALYGIHGLLHLLGHDDHEPDAWRRMHAEEDRLLRALGLGEVFRRDRDARAPGEGAS